jgi:hypothetical protein
VKKGSGVRAQKNLEATRKKNRCEVIRREGETRVNVWKRILWRLANGREEAKV